MEIISLTAKGDSLRHSVRRSNDIAWSAIYFLGKNGGRATKEKICQFCYGGNMAVTSSVIRRLKMKGIVTGE